MQPASPRSNIRKSLSLILLAVTLTALQTPASAQAQNLLANPSFEETQAYDKAGVQFKDWTGQIDLRPKPPVDDFNNGYLNRNPYRFQAGVIAHSGKRSFEMVGEMGCDLRLLGPDIQLKPGRYKLSMFVRGLSVGKNKAGRQIELGVAPQQAIDLKKDGTFGWTPLTYVFDADATAQAKPFQLTLGLVSSGWLWVDDVSLQVVDAQTPLSAEPVWGKEESPIAAATKPASQAETINCPQCGYIVNPADKQCYACGQEISFDQVSWPVAKLLADVPTAELAGGQAVDDSPLGKGALRVAKSIAANGNMDLSRYDYLVCDTYNPTKDPIDVRFMLADARTDDYWTRLNTNTYVPPGVGRFCIPLDSYIGEKSRPDRNLLRGSVLTVAVSPRQPLDIINLRVVRADASAVKFAGLRAFDFGPLQSGVMDGFSQVTSAMKYEPLRGFGWENADIVRAITALQPDALFQDWINIRQGGFRVDLPNGKYHVIMNLDMPGAFWGQVENYTQRTVKANGKVVVDDKMDLKSFVKSYFRNAHGEDQFETDIYKKYVDAVFSPKQFDVEVTDGKLVLDFTGEDCANSLSALVIYPADQASQDQGKKFWDWVSKRRREQFEDYFHMIKPRGVAAKPAEGYVLFRRNMMTEVGPVDGPAAGEDIPSEGLKQTVAMGEESPVVFSLQPSGNIGQIDVSISDLVNQDKAVLPASAIRSGYIDYRLQRLNADGTGYTISPRYWQVAPAPAGDVTRTFWIRVNVPAGTPAGNYTGTITVKPAKADAKTIPLAIRVLNFSIDPITDVETGPWYSQFRLPWTTPSPEVDAWKWEMFGKALTVIHDSGCTSFSGRPSLKAYAKDGKITLDTELADREMALIREKGFTMGICTYGQQYILPYAWSGALDVRSAKEAGFADMDTFLLTLWTAIDNHAVEKNWLPIAWGEICDEPIDKDLKDAAINAQAHRKAAANLKRSTFLGATSLSRGAAGKPDLLALVKALPIVSLGGHDEAAIKIIHDAGNQFSFYNGSNRWTMGRYMKMLVYKHQMVYRLIWNFNAIKGDPYNALDCREDDFCWYNTDEEQTMVPAVDFLRTVVAGLNDYRYLSTLQRLLKEKPDHPAAAQAKKVFDEMMNLTAGKDSRRKGDYDFDKDRAEIAAAIESLLK
jgi:hypothetical protein